MSHRVTRSWAEHLRNAVPLGLGQTKPKHFRDMADIVWRNRDNLGYAWKVVTRGSATAALWVWRVCMTGPSRARTSA